MAFVMKLPRALRALLSDKPLPPYDELIFRDGRIAAECGVPRQACPYDQGTHERDSWLAGHKRFIEDEMRIW